MKRKVTLLSIGVCLALLVACASGTSAPVAEGKVSGTAGALTATDAWVRNSPMPMMRAGAAYMVISNTGSAPDKLVAVKTDIADNPELHETITSGGMMSMSPVEAITIPITVSAELKPGGYHIMLMNLTRSLQAGEVVTLTLTFENAGEMVVTAKVQE